MVKDPKTWLLKKKFDKLTGTHTTQEKELVTKALKAMQPSWDNLQANEFIEHTKRLNVCLKAWPLLSEKKEVKYTCFQEVSHLWLLSWSLFSILCISHEIHQLFLLTYLPFFFLLFLILFPMDKVRPNVFFLSALSSKYLFNTYCPFSKVI